MGAIICPLTPILHNLLLILKLYIAKYFTKKIWETISDLNVHVQVAKASVFFRRCTLLKILPKIGTGLILLAPSVCIG